MKDFAIKLNSFFSRIARYFVFSAIITSVICLALIVGNLFAGVIVSLSFYFIFHVGATVALTILIALFNSHKLFVPINKPLIMKLEQEKVERARRKNRDRIHNRKIS